MVPDMKPIHTLTMENKENITVTGVCDVDTFDENKITILTDEDILTVEGEELHIKKLDVANGVMDITGYIYALSYTGRDSDSRGKSFFRRMLK